METEITENTSKRITSLRYLLIVLVVFIHNNYRTESVEKAKQFGNIILFNQSQIGRWIQLFISNGIALCSVPVFFMFSSFLQVKKGLPYKVLIKKRMQSLLIPFLIWPIFNLLLTTFVKILLPSSLFNNSEAFSFISWKPLDWFHFFLGYNISSFDLHPYVGQFWFIRDLLILIIISPLIIYIIKNFPISFFIFTICMYFCDINLYVIEQKSLFYYVMGCYWAVYDFDLFCFVDKIRITCLFPIFVMLFLFTYLFSKNSYVIMELVSCLMILKLSKFIISHETLNSLCIKLASYSFFLFCIHMPFLLGALQRLWIKVFPMKDGFFCLFEYFCVTFLTIIIGTSIGFFLKKYLPKTFAFSTGGRK